MRITLSSFHPHSLSRLDAVNELQMPHQSPSGLQHFSYKHCTYKNSIIKHQQQVAVMLIGHLRPINHLRIWIPFSSSRGST